MEIFKVTIIFALTALAAQASELGSTIQPISEVEAAAIVKSQEEARERAKDLREHELRSADVRASASAKVGKREVLFNLVDHVEPEENAPGRLVATPNASADLLGLSERMQAIEKEFVQITLSGTVWDESVSELWWDYDGGRYRVFANANFLLFPGLGEFEDEKTRYSLMTLITGQSSGRAEAEDQQWRPDLIDFSSEALEYIVVDPKDDAKIDPAAFLGIEAMLRHYAVHHEEMQILYDNAQKLRKARAAYLEANPPKQRDTIINFRPKKHTSDSLSAEK